MDGIYFFFFFYVIAREGSGMKSRAGVGGPIMFIGGSMLVLHTPTG